jgi:hypothetical protein
MMLMGDFVSCISTGNGQINMAQTRRMCPESGQGATIVLAMPIR